MPGGQPHDRLPGQGRQRTTRLSAPRAGTRRRLDDHARQAQRHARSSSSTPTRAAPPKPGIAILRAADETATSPTSWSRSSPPSSSKSTSARPSQFPLETTIAVQEGRHRRADRARRGRPRSRSASATTPRGAPAAQKKQCSRPARRARRRQIGSSVQYYCLYQTARLTYSADADLDALGRRWRRAAYSLRACGALAPPVGLGAWPPDLSVSLSLPRRRRRIRLGFFFAGRRAAAAAVRCRRFRCASVAARLRPVRCAFAGGARFRRRVVLSTSSARRPFRRSCRSAG